MQRAMKWFLSLLGSMAILCGGFLVLHGSLPPASTNAWLPAGNLAAARAGAASVLLQDGRLLITGGNAASGVLASTEILDPSSGITAGPPMNLARSSHVAVLLQDGRVLVAGGTGADGRASQSAELFDPANNTWSAAGPLMVPRSGETATLLADGRVLVAGGTANGAALASLELFDPNSNTFTLVAGTLSSARENHAAALLPDGRVLIAGGWDGTTASGGGSNVLASSDIFDPTTGTVAPGPALASPRMNFTATTALDGSVVAIGGTDGQNDLASIGVLVPGAGAFALSGAQLATARQGQQAFLLPHNGNILVVGGTSSGVSVSSAELYTPWLGATSVTGAMASARSFATGSPLFQTILGAPVGIDGALLVAGGVDASSPPATLQSAEVYGFATIKSDKADYAPGETAYISGSGWQPNEVVQMSLVENPDLDGDSPIALTSTADVNGNLPSVSFPIDAADANIHFTLTAVGTVSQAQTTFTDSINTDTTISSDHTPATAGQLVTYTATVITHTGGTAVTQGNVQFYLGGTSCSGGSVGTTIGSAVALNGSGVAEQTYIFSSGTTGTKIFACYLGYGSPSSGFGTSSDSLTQVVNAATTVAITIDSSPTGRTVTVDGTDYTAPHIFNWNPADTHTISVSSPQSGSTGTRYVYSSWSDSGAQSHTITVPSTATTYTANFTTQYQLTLGITAGVPGGTGTNITGGATGTYYDSGTALSLTAATPVADGATQQWVFTNWTGDVASPPNTNNPVSVTMDAPKSVTANYTSQYEVTFDASANVKGDSTATIVTVDGSPKTAADLPFHKYTNDGRSVTYSYASPVASSGASTTTQYRWDTTSGLTQTLQSNTFTVSTSGTVTGNYVTQYKVTFDASSDVKADGTGTIVTVAGNAKTAGDLPFTTGFLDSGSSLSYSYTSPVPVSSSKRYRWNSTSGLGQTLQATSFNVTAAGTVTGTYVAQYQITFAQSGLSADATGTVVTVGASAKAYGDLPFSDWFDDGSSLTYAYSSPVASTTTGKQYALTTPAPLPASGFSVSSSITITGTYKVQWLITFAATGLGGDVTPGSTIVTVNSAGQTAVPYSVFLDAGSTAAYAYSSPITTTVTGKRYILTTPAPTPASGFTVTGTLTITATYKPQYDTTTVVASPVANPSILGQPIHFTATVSTIASGGGTPTGSVQFSIDGNPFGSAINLVLGVATTPDTSSLTVGNHSVTAVYTPATDDFTGSSGGPLTQTVQYSTGACLGSPGHTILPPIDPFGTSVFKQKSTVPAKFRVCDFNGNSIGTPGVVQSFNIVGVAGGTVDTGLTLDVPSTTPDLVFRWDPTDQQWIFNISTKSLKAGNTYWFQILLNDGTIVSQIPIIAGDPFSGQPGFQFGLK